MYAFENMGHIIDFFKYSPLKDHLEKNEKDGKYIGLMFPKHMLRSNHDGHQEYDSHSSTRLLSE
jgi:hypothetical protein